MSAHARSSPRANGGVVVSVTPEDYGGAGAPLAGVAFQRRLEQEAFVLGGEDYRAPAQTVVDFLAGRPTDRSLRSSYRPGVRPADLASCLPPWVVAALRDALASFDGSMPGFAAPEAILVGVETRTSAPVQIPREASGEAVGARGLHPTGEGAGAAGGIVTAAVDGIHQARNVLRALGVT